MKIVGTYEVHSTVTIYPLVHENDSMAVDGNYKRFTAS